MCRVYFPGNGASIPSGCSEFGDFSSHSRSSPHLERERSEMFTANKPLPLLFHKALWASQSLLIEVMSYAPSIFSLDDGSVNLLVFLFCFFNASITLASE